MRKLEIEVPESLYLQAFEQYGSRKKIEDMISIRIESNIRKNRKLISKPEPERRIIISVYIKEHLYPYFNELLIQRSESKQSYITRMLKRIIK
jgi:hypothetical protein